VVLGLYEGRYQPGQRLTEAKLTAQFGTSRGPVREALNRLAALGVVELAPRRGAQVKVLATCEAIDILVVVQSLLSTAARLAAQNIDAPGARERMEAAWTSISRFDPASAEGDFGVARNAFYATLMDIAGNSALQRIMPGVQIHLVRVQFRSVLRASDSTRHASYRKITEAVVAGKPALAGSLVSTHLKRAVMALINHAREG
jgi:DNA-binding GntR family transcriptional regulator